MAFNHLIQGAVFFPGYEEDALSTPGREQLEVIVGSVHGHNGARRQPEHPGGIYVTAFAVTKIGPTWQIALMVQQKMELDRSFGSTEVRPVENFQAQVNDAGVNAVERIFELEFPLVAVGQGLDDFQCLVKYRFIELPRPMGVGIGQGRFLWRRLYSQMVYLAANRRQAAGYLPRAC